MADSGNPTPRVGSEHKYAAIARFKHSQHLDYDKEIGTLISENRHAFEDVVDRINAHLTKLGVPDSHPPRRQGGRRAVRTGRPCVDEAGVSAPVSPLGIGDARL
jgi:hypothetical protein